MERGKPVWGPLISYCRRALLIAWLGLLGVLADLPSASMVHAQSPSVRQIGELEQWIVPEARGYGDPAEGRPYVGVTLENSEDYPISVDVLFAVSGDDGTRDRNCSTRVSIAPGQRARAVCRPFSVLSLTADPRVLTIRAAATALVTPQTDFGVVDAALVLDSQTPSGSIYTATADVRSPASGTGRETLRFRFYTADGTQVGECDTNALQAQPGEIQRVQCLGSGPAIDAASHQPITVSAEPSSVLRRW